jgi:hypothetical protein
MKESKVSDGIQTQNVGLWWDSNPKCWSLVGFKPKMLVSGGIQTQNIEEQVV